MENVNINYATKDNLILPKGGVIEHEENENDFIFGASGVSENRKILQVNKSWLEVELKLQSQIGQSNIEIQKTKDGQDTFWCVSFSNNNVNRLLHYRKYGYDLNMDERFLAIGSGTIPYRGNSLKAVVDFNRKSGFNKQDKQTKEMTLDECYAKLSSFDYDEGKKSLEVYEFPYELLPRSHNGFSSLPYSDTATLLSAFAYAPLMVTVDGNYDMDGEGRIGTFGANGKALNYNHEVVLLGAHFDGTTIDWWDVKCSETKQLLKFRPDYKFGWPCLKDIKKNSMQLFKEKTKAPVYFLNSSDNLLVAYADGVITGGEMFKMIFGDYKWANITVVEDGQLPYPIAPYQMKTV